MLPLRDHTPTRSIVVVNYVLIALNVLAYALQYAMETAGAPWVTNWYGLVPRRLFADPPGEAFTVLTSMFMHGDLAHLGGNLLFLWIFGDNIEDSVGKLRYLLFYLVGGVGAAAAQIAVDPTSTIPMVGASGAISAVLGAYLVLYPRSSVTVLNPVLPLWLLLGPFFRLPAWVVIGFWFLFDNLLKGLVSLGMPSQGGVAFWAHIGGFVVGLLLVKPFMLARTAATPDPWQGWRPPPRLGPQHPQPRSQRDPWSYH
jgi:membrane associated rhomboid family serine protease